MKSKHSTTGYDVDDSGNQVFDFLVLDARKLIPYELQTCGIPGCGARFPIVDYKEHQLVCPAVASWIQLLQSTSPLSDQPMNPS